MKHQISLVGGQLLPVYLAIKELNPEKIHFIVSKETINNIRVLKPMLRNISNDIHICNPYDFFSIKNLYEQIIEKLNKSDDVTFNLTGGTKIMVLAAQAIIHEKNIKGYYINQNNTILELPNYSSQEIKTELSIQEFLDLSGHHFYSAMDFNDFTQENFKIARAIEIFANNDKRYTSITSFIRRKYKIVPNKGNEVIGDNIKLSWQNNTVSAVQNEQIVMKFNAKNIIDLFFNAAWWELLVAEEISKWDKAKELLVKCELPFKTNTKIPKNEIDILVNTGKKLIFVECKSGNVLQEDINKMRVVKQTYGGIISKSILVSRFMPNSTILEKCKELDIEVFYCYSSPRQISQLNKLISILNGLEKKVTI